MTNQVLTNECRNRMHVLLKFCGNLLPCLHHTIVGEVLVDEAQVGLVWASVAGVGECR